jgi:hypothetical protein
LTAIKFARPAAAMMSVSNSMEGIMHKVTARVVARPAHEQNPAYATEWSMALWVLALAFLLATFQVY